MKNRTLLFVAAFIFAIIPMVASNTAISEKTLTISKSLDYCGVTDDQIIEYMLQFGFHVCGTQQITGSCDVYVKTIEKRQFVIHIEQGAIIGHNEVDF